MKFRFQARHLPVCSFLLLCLLTALRPEAQYFGRNKVLYRNFDFRIARTPHFDIYHYLGNRQVRDRFARLTEQWYLMHQRVLRDTFTNRNPLIVYNHHAHFQQTRAIEGQIDVGTGGVTEALKNRVILPFMESNAQTDHVLGHELVHAFQYHLVLDSLGLNALNNLPLWMVEGMAEYMSTGHVDPNTAMWLRSALAANRLPTLKDLTNRPDLYFPYRWGEAFWAYTTGVYGDTVIRRLFLETARRGYPAAIKFLFGIDEQEFSRRWQESIRTYFAPWQKDTRATPPGRALIHRSNAGELNIVPSLSPNGKLIAYWTEKNLFSLDLYIADATSGRTIERVTSTRFNAHIDQYSSYESSVAWSPDSRRLAFVAFARGRNRLLIVNTGGKILQEIDLPQVSGFSNPAWSPDGKMIVVTGIVDGQGDLFAYDLETRALRQLTRDLASNLQASFSPDGQYLVFATDEGSLARTSLVHRYAHNLALLELATGRIRTLEFFNGASNLNPVFSPDSKSIYFLSDREGLRDLYRYDLPSGQIQQLTRLFSGISGITAFAPAVSVSRQTGQIAFTYFNNWDYVIYSADPDSLQPQPVQPGDVHMAAALLPPAQRKGADLVQRQLETPPASAAVIEEASYKPRFELDYIGSTGIGLQTGGVYGTGLAGGVNGLFSDILGNHQMFGAISLNGEIVDVAGQFAYINQKRRFNWGASVSHIPYLSGQQYLFRDTITHANNDTLPVINSSLDLLRTFQDQVSLFGSFPFSTIRRLEAGASFARYYYRLDRYTDYYDPTGTIYYGNTREAQDVPSGFNLGQAYLALVGDNSFFGVASPLDGHRFRLEAGQYLGAIRLSNLQADYRRYFRSAPLTLATRNLFVGRYGRDAETGLLPPLFLGYPTLVRGYNALEYAEDKGSGGGLSINDLVGSRIYVGNVELRLPLTGPERLSVVKSRFLFSELNLFTDGGIAWGQQEFLGNGPKNPDLGRSSKLILSTGVSLRANLFGYLVLEPYYAFPWQNGGWRGGNFGINIQPGW